MDMGDFSFAQMTAAQWLSSLWAALILVVSAIVWGITKHAANKPFTQEKEAWNKWARIAGIVSQTVNRDVEQEIKKAVENDGVLDEAEFKKVTAAAMNAVRSMWSPEVMDEVSKALKLPMGGLGEWVARQVLEHYLGEYKKPTVPQDDVAVVKTELRVEPAIVPAPVLPPLPTISDDVQYPEQQTVTIRGRTLEEIAEDERSGQTGGG